MSEETISSKFAFDIINSLSAHSLKGAVSLLTPYHEPPASLMLASKARPHRLLYCMPNNDELHLLKKSKKLLLWIANKARQSLCIVAVILSASELSFFSKNRVRRISFMDASSDGQITRFVGSRAVDMRNRMQKQTSCGAIVASRR